MRTKIQGGNLRAFATPYYSGYYTNILTPRELAIAPDLSYMYVADWELFLVFGYGGQYGDKVGLIRNPFGLPQFGPTAYLGSTTPLESAFTTSVAVTGDGSRLFAAYAGVGEVLVFDTAGLIATAEARIADPIQAERVPLDLIRSGNDFVVNDSVFAFGPPASLTVPGLTQGLAAQSGDYVSLQEFGSESVTASTATGLVRLAYKVQTADSRPLKNGFKVEIYGVPRQKPGVTDLSPVFLGEIEINKDNVGTGKVIASILDENHAAQSPSDMLNGGLHYAILDPSIVTFLKDGLLNEDYELIIAQADDKIASSHGEVEFAGFYMAAGGVGVLRTGSENDDTIEINNSNQTTWMSNGAFPQEVKKFNGPTSILIVTSSGEDTIRALGNASDRTTTPLVVYAGEGADKVIGGEGNDRLDAGPETDLSDGTYDFNVLVGNGGNDTLTGSDAKDILIGDGFEISYSDLQNMVLDLSRGRIRLVSTSITPTGAGDDSIVGGDGFDVLIGGAGNDKLDDGKGFGGLLLGDTFQASASLDFDLGAFFSGTYTDFLTDLAQGPLGYFDAIVNLMQVGDGKDTIMGGAGIDFIMGGAGNDTIDASMSYFAIAFGGKGADIMTGADIASIMWGDDLLASEMGPTENDTMKATAYSSLNVFIGGEGNDTLTGARGGIDILLGDGINLKLAEALKFSEGLKLGEVGIPLSLGLELPGQDHHGRPRQRRDQREHRLALRLRCHLGRRRQRHHQGKRLADRWQLRVPALGLGLRSPVQPR